MLYCSLEIADALLFQLRFSLHLWRISAVMSSLAVVAPLMSFHHREMKSALDADSS